MKPCPNVRREFSEQTQSRSNRDRRENPDTCYRATKRCSSTAPSSATFPCTKNTQSRSRSWRMRTIRSGSVLAFDQPGTHGIWGTGRGLQRGHRSLRTWAGSFLQVASATPGILLLVPTLIPSPVCHPFRCRCKMEDPASCVSTKTVRRK